MSIKIGYDFNNKSFISNEIKENIKEIEIANKIMNKIENLKIEKKSDSYTTLCFNGSDVVRITFNSRSNFINLALSSEDKERNRNNEMFDLQKNKNQLFWKTNYDENKLDVYVEFINNYIEEIKKIN